MYLDDNVLELPHFDSTTWSHVPLISHAKSDYVHVRLHRPSVAGQSSFSAVTALTEQSVARIDLTHQLSGHAKLILLHLRYSCPGRTIMQQLLKNADVDPTIPEDFHCPVCMSKKTISLPRGPAHSVSTTSPDWFPSTNGLRFLKKRPLPVVSAAFFSSPKLAPLTNGRSFVVPNILPLDSASGSSNCFDAP
jgi:hypothetical protein